LPKLQQQEVAMRDFEIELGQMINETIRVAATGQTDTIIAQIIEALDMNVLLLEERRAPADAGQAPVKD
jgi:hypothetical protein